MKKRLAILIIVIITSLSLGFVLAKVIMPKISENSVNDTTNNNSIIESKDEETKSNWKDKFKEIIKGYQETENVVYNLTDIQKDNVPELVIRTGSSEVEYMYYFYSFKDDVVSMIGEIGAGHTLLYEINDEKYIMAVYAHMGYETVSNISIVDNKIKYEEVSKIEIDINEEYTEGDKYIELYDVSNLEIIDNY